MTTIENSRIKQDSTAFSHPGHWSAQAVYVAAKLGIADHLKDGPLSNEELANAVGAHPESLYRLLRALSSIGVFTQLPDQRFALTQNSWFFQTGIKGSVRNLLLTINELDWKAWGSLLHSIKTGQTAFDHVYGMSAYEYCRCNPETAKMFDAAMTDFVTENGLAAISAYDFGYFAEIVDVGGGHGTLMIEILKATPSLQGIIFDLPEVIEGTGRQIEDSGLSSRCKCIPGDFFSSVPSGSDAYILSSVIHNWDDDHSLSILGNCRHAMSRGSKILLIEMVIPPSGGEPFEGKWLDLEMLVCFGGKERTAAEYESLLSRTGFRLLRIIPAPAPSLSSLIEAEPA